MIDITHKKKSLRIATATAIVRCAKETIEAVKNKTVPKGDVLEMAKTAGLFAVKRTADMIPDCHPLPVEYTGITYEIKDNEIHIFITVKAIYRTGLEVEAMHGASVIALTMYDMLKPIDKKIEIRNIKLIQKSGGKSDINKSIPKNLTATILTISDLVVEGQKEDKSGKAIKQQLLELPVTLKDHLVMRSDKNKVQQQLNKWVDEQINLIIITGGTGLSETDLTLSYVRPILDREIPSVIHQLSNYNMERTYRSLVSTPLAGTIKKTVVVCLPGSENGAIDSFNAIMPETLFLFKSINYNS